MSQQHPGLYPGPDGADDYFTTVKGGFSSTAKVAATDSGSGGGGGGITGVGVKANGVAAGTEPTISLIAGNGNVVIAAVDNPGATEVDVTLSAFQTVEVDGVVKGTELAINLISGTNVTLSGSDNPGSNRVDVTFNSAGATGPQGPAGVAGANGGGGFGFGDGSDGALVYDGAATILGMAPVANVYTLTRNIFPSAMTVNVGVKIVPAGFLIMVSGTLTNNGTIHNNGGNASGATAGAKAYGVAGAYLRLGGVDGTNGGTGVGTASAAAAGFGGVGGAGGAGTSGAGGAAGAITAPTAAQGGTAPLRMWGGWWSPVTSGEFLFTTAAALVGGNSGGTGAGDGVNNGGASGASGGWVIVCANIITGTGTISSNGGAGGNASAGNCGGGGGAGGGVVSIFYGTISGQTVTATGGAGGAKTGTGVAGSTGAAGATFQIQQNGTSGGSSGANANDTFIVKTAAGSADLPNAQAMGSLATGIVKNTTTTGVQSISVPDVDYATPAYVTTAVAAVAAAPTGGIIMWGKTTPPTGWLVCDGSAVSRVTYSALFAILSTTYGIGDNVTTFNLPDLRSRSPVGYAAADPDGTRSARALAAVGGEENHGLTIAEMPNHNHTYNAPQTIGGNNVDGSSTSLHAVTSSTGSNTGFAGSSNAHNTMHPFQVVNYIIKT